MFYIWTVVIERHLRALIYSFINVTVMIYVLCSVCIEYNGVRAVKETTYLLHWDPSSGYKIAAISLILRIFFKAKLFL